MRKAITLFILCWALAFNASSMGTDFLPLSTINGN